MWLTLFCFFDSLAKEKRTHLFLALDCGQVWQTNWSSLYSGKSSSGKTGGDGKAQSRSAKAGLQFPVGRIHRLLKRGNYAQRVGAGAPGMYIFMLLFIITNFFYFKYTLLPSWSTLPQKFSNSQVTLLVITRSNVLSPVICSSPSVTTKSTSLYVSLLWLRTHNTIFRLNKLLGSVVISQGGVVPHINPELLPNKSSKGKKEGASQEV